MRFIHTSDWHIGKVFGFVDDADKAGVLRHARLDAITRTGHLAREHGAEAVLVAGDVFDRLDVGDQTGAEPLQRMRHCPWVQWHLIPGNHDAFQPSSIWDRLTRHDVPENIHVHLSNAPVRLRDGAVILPAPLTRRRTLSDPTAWMDEAPDLPLDSIRIGLAHGVDRDFGSSTNLITPDRVRSAGLDYLALGDAHGCRQVAERCWYSGTPEPADFDEHASGSVLLVDIDGRGAPASVSELTSGHHVWRREQAEVHDAADIERLEQRILMMSIDDPARLVVQLRVEGTLSLTDADLFERIIGAERNGGRLRAAVCWLRLERGLHARPNTADLEAIAPRGGVLRAAAERLLARIEAGGADEQPLIERALLRLYNEQRKLGT